MSDDNNFLDDFNSMSTDVFSSNNINFYDDLKNMIGQPCNIEYELVQLFETAMKREDELGYVVGMGLTWFDEI